MRGTPRFGASDVDWPTVWPGRPVLEWQHHAMGREIWGNTTIMSDSSDVDVTVIEIDSDGDGLSDEELVIVEDAG